jgi:hypothetical protein
MHRWSIAVRSILYLQRCDRGSLLTIGLELPAMLLSRDDRIASESELGALSDSSPQTADKRKLSGPDNYFIPTSAPLKSCMKFPVIFQKFPVREKSLRHSGFVQRNWLLRAQNRKIPCNVERAIGRPYDVDSCDDKRKRRSGWTSSAKIE